MEASELTTKMEKCGISVDQMAQHLQIDRSTFYRKLKRPSSSFTVEEAGEIAKLLRLTKTEVNRIFFGL